MKLVILGSAGAVPGPLPCSRDKWSQHYRRAGLYRTGPSMYLYDEAMLFDTPEESRWQLNREQVPAVRHIFYTHWHPDHTAGSRIIEHLGRGGSRPKVYIPGEDPAGFEKVGLIAQFEYYESQGWMKLARLRDRRVVKIGRAKVTPLSMRKDRVRYAYRVDLGGKSLLYAPCSIYGMRLDSHHRGLDLAMLETGWVGQREKLRKKYPLVGDHISLAEDFELFREIGAKRNILTHIECADLSPADNLEREAARHNVELAYDGMRVRL